MDKIEKNNLGPDYLKITQIRRKTTILQPVDQKPQLQKDREDEKAEGYVPDEGTRKNPRKTTK